MYSLICYKPFVLLFALILVYRRLVNLVLICIFCSLILSICMMYRECLYQTLKKFDFLKKLVNVVKVTFIRL
jgi:hypothetical protein